MDMEAEQTHRIIMKNLDLDSLKGKIESTMDSIESYEQIIIGLEQDYELKKLNYEMEVITLKYSEEYKEYKSLTQKEEQARLTLKDMKKGLIIDEMELAKYKKEVGQNRLLLKYLFRLYNEKVMYND